MRDTENKYKQLQYESYCNQNDSPCRGVENVNIIVHKKKVKNRNKYERSKCQQPAISLRPSRFGTNQTRILLKKPSSMPEINKRTKLVKQRTRSSDAILKKKYRYFNSKFIVNRVSEYNFKEYLSPFNYPTQKKWKVYRCQLSNQEDSCCCSCNSDAMFEVMKSLYDCYKKKNCDNCNCILCGHLPREERRLGEVKKSLESVGLGGTKERKAKIKKAEKAIKGKTKEEKEKILKDLAKAGEPLPEGKTASEKAMIRRIRTEVGLPPEPKTISEKVKMRKAEAAGVMTPLEGKTASQKEKILKAQAQLGVPLPEGRTASEKALIHRIKTEAGIPEGITSEKLKKAKAAGLITPLAGKSPEQKEKILRGLAMEGIPLPEGKTASEKKLIEKVRADLGLPPEPKTSSMREKYADAANAGYMQPLEGKSPKEKERILQGLADRGIPLPEGRTASEKELIAKVKAKARPLEVAPSERIRRAKAAGLLTPLEDKTPEQKEKILRGLAMQGIPLPEAKTASERKLVDKVRADLGLPPEPRTTSMKEKHDQAAKAGLLQPLEGKSTKEKEKILQGLHDLGIPLPEGRTASEKAIIAKVKAGPRAPLVLAPSEKLRKAKAAGLLTPLEGKTPEQKENILRGLAMQGIPLPEGKTASERKLIDKVRTDLGLPPEPKTASMRNKYARAADVGLLQPLEGKSPKEKERILQGLYDMGVPLPEGRTASEKALIAKVKAGPRAPTVLAPSEKLQKAKAAGLLTPLEGKTPEQKEKILKGLAMQGIVLPEGKTASERKLIDKVRADLGLPPEPKTASMRDKHARAADAGLLQPLEGKSAKEKEKILQGLHDMGIALPEGRTASEKAIIAKVKAGSRAPSVLAPSEKLRRAKAAGLLTPLTDKTPAQREKILRGLAMQGVPLPEGKTASEKMLIDKVRADLGLPPEPKTSSMKEKHAKAADAGLLQPLEGKPPKEKERILQGLHDMGIPLPEGRTTSEKALIAKVKAGARAPSVMSEKVRKAKAAGLLTPLEGKTPAQKEKIIKGLAMQGLPLPEGKTASERKLINKVRADLGLPPEPKTPSMKEKYAKAANAGLLQPLEGKSTKEKEKILQGLHDMGIPLPEGRTSSEKALIAKVKASPRAPSLHVPSEKMRKAQAAGLITPLEGKSAAQKEKILRGLAMEGIPLPEGKTASEKRIADKVRADLGLPPAPKTAADREKYNKAAEAGLIIPLEGKSHDEKEKILRGQHDLGLPLPEGRTTSEKALIRQIKASKPRKTKAVGVGQPALPPDKRRKLDEKTAKVVKEGKGPADECICGLLTPESEREAIKAAKIPSEKLKAAKAAGLLTPLEGKTPEQREKILRGLAKQGLPLPEAKTASEKRIIDKVRADLGLPPEPKTSSMKAKHARAQEKGLLTPLDGKTASEKEKILRGQAEMGIPLPVGRTASEKALISKIKASTAPSITTEKLRKAKAAGLLTPLEGKTDEQKEKILRGLAKSGLPLPEGKTASEKALIKKIKSDLGIPQRTPSEKIRRAKTAGLLTPLEGKTKSQKEKILRGRAAAGLPLPVGKTPSERALIQKIKEDSGYVTPSPSERLKRAKAAGLLTPLEGKTHSQKEKIIRDRLAAGVPITEGKTPSEKEIIKKITAGEPPAVRKLSEKERRAKAAGLMTPLEGKTKEQKEKILRGLVKAGVPLPEPTSASERDLMDKIRLEVGLPPEPKTPSLKEKYKKAHIAGIITPLEGKTPAEKEKILRKLHDAGIPLPEGRTPSEKSMVKRIKAGISEPRIPSEKLRAAKAAGLLTPLEGKSKTEKEKILKGLAKAGLPMPEPKTASEKELIKKVRTELGLPPEAATASIKEKMQRAQAAGKITPLEGKTTEEKKKILRSLAEAGIPLPEGRTASEKALISKIKAETKPKKITPEKLAKAKEAGLLTPLAGKSDKEKERILRGLVEQGLPLPEAQTASEKKISEKIRKEFGLPPEPKNSAERVKMRKAQTAGIVTPLEGKTNSQKEKILRRLDEAGIPLPEGRTASEKSMIRRIKAKEGRPPSPRRAGPPALPPKERAKLDKKTAKVMKEGKGPSDECICGLLTPESEREEAPTKITSEKLKKAKAAGLLTPLEGKTTAEKEKILKGLAKEGLPLPEAKTSSERKLHDKIRKELGLPPEPTTSSIRGRHEKAAAAGVLVPLEGLSPEEKERILRAQADLGIPLPEGRTASEKALIAKVKAESKAPPAKIPSEKLRKAKAAGLLTPLEGKTKKQKEKILRGLAKQGLPLPEAKTASERKLHDKIRKELGLPPEPTTSSIRDRHEKAAAAGVLVPLEGLPPAEKERILRAQADLGIPLPEGRTASEKALIAKVKAERKAVSAKIPSDRLQKAKAAGLLTPLEGKPTAEKERILRGLAKQGLPLPEAKTASERKLHDKIRKELGLPPEPTTSSIRHRHEKAAAAGVLVPLEGLPPEEKERILRAQADLGIPLPEGRTASEKALIAKVKAERKAVSAKIPSDKLQKARAAGLLTPLEGKPTAEKERILRGLAKQGLPLPEAKTASERKLHDKIRKELGLPPEPTTSSIRHKHEKAAAAGVLVPLEGLPPEEKERILRAQADLGIPLPEGRTASEKALIAKVKAESKAPPAKIPSEKLRKAKAAGLLTPLEGKTKKQKEKILRGLAKQGLPLPEAKTASERKLHDKIRKELGLPPEPTTSSIRDRHEKAAAAGVLVPLEGLPPAEKERILRAQADLGIPLPEGRTASEKALIAKVKAERKAVSAKIPSDRLQKAKAAGLLTPLEGKPTAEKERILRGLAKQGLPLPEAKTASERKLHDKIRKEVGLPPEPTTSSIRHRHEKAAAAGVLVPLEGLPPEEKERILRAQADLGIPLPEGRTASEKALIAKVKAESKAPPAKIPSEKLRKAEAAGLLTPLEGKTKKQKEKILRGLAKQGLPLPEATTASERKLHDKIRKELGLPPEPANPSMRQKHEQAAAAGVLVPLDGLSQEEKKKILRGQANLGIPLPEGRTASEKALIAQIKAEQEPSKIPSEKLRKAKAAGLLTPLEGKTTAQKEKIIKNLAEAGLPLPEGKTASEKALIQKIRTEMGIPPPARTASEKSVVRKARAEGLLTPLAGKSAKEKERIVKGLIDAGLPVPEGKTSSEKELIRKVRIAAGLPPEKTPSERKAEIKTKSKKVGVTPSKRVTKGVAAKAGIDEEYEDIIKTTTCDRGCGCDKKKIRFKHSYVKIRVTSPDISSLCPCPDECIPGVKNGAFIDNEGIKVTVGRVDCVTSYSSQFSNHILEGPHKIVTLFDKKLTNSFSSNTSLDSVDTPPERIVTNDLQNVNSDEYSSEKYISNDGEPNYDITSSFSYTSGYDSHDSIKTINTESNKSFSYESKTLYEKWSDESDRFLDTSKYFQSLEDIYRNPASISCTSCECIIMEKSSRDSFDSNLVIKSESSLSLSTKLSRSMDVISVISISNSSSTSDSSHYLYYPASNIHLSNSAVETSGCFMNGMNYSKSDYTSDDTVTRSNEQIHEARNGMKRRDRDNRDKAFSGEKGNDYFTYRLSQTKLCDAHRINRISTRKTNNGEPVIVINNLDSDQDITTMVDQLLSNNEFSNTSSIFVVVPTSDDNDSETSSSSLNSTICIQLSENHPHRKQYQTGISEAAATSRRNSSNTRGLKISAKGKMFCMEGMSEAVSSYHKDSMLFKLPHIYKQKENKKSKNKLCQITSPNAVTKLLPPGVSTDTTSDRPCCCAPKKPGDTHHRHGSEHRCVANVVSELITPLLVHQGLNCDKVRVQKRNVNQQASFVSISQSPISVTPCQVPPCAGQTGCHHPLDMLQIPFGTPMPEPIPEPEPRHSQPCQCNPEKLKQLLDEAVKAGKTSNMTSIGCGLDVNAISKQPPSQLPPPPILTKPITQLENCASCAKHKYTDGLDMFCACSGKKRSVKLKPLCPCELHHPPVSQTVTGPKTGTRSLGCQCCLCEDSTLCGSGKKSKPGQIEILGPAGGLVLLEQGGAYTQAGMRPTQTSIDSSKKKHCACSGKNGKKNKNIICECPPPEPKPEPEIIYIPEIIPMKLSYEQYKSYQMQETKEAMKMRSDMTQTQSGFKMFKKKKPPPPPEVEFTVEDAVRYYATMNPELVRDLVPPPQEFRETTEMPDDCTCEEEDRKKSKRNGVQCECPYETPPPPPPPPPEPEPVIEVEEPPPKGFKFSMGGKGSGSKGLSGVCCFDMFEEVKKKQL